MKKTSKSVIAILAAGFLSCGLFNEVATATLITGSISFVGQVQYDTGSLNTADAITLWDNARVQGSSGSFGGIAQNTAANFNAPWNFDPSTPMLGIWSVGGFTFDLLTSTIVSQGGGFLTIRGTGIVGSTNQAFESTVGDWVYSSQDLSTRGKFNFLTGGNNTVPEGGSALVLLGVGLIVIETLRRRFEAAQGVPRRVTIT